MAIVRTTEKRRIRWRILIGLPLMHAVASLAPWYFSWEALACAALLYVLTGPVGISIGYHRLLTHRSFKATPALRLLLATCGGLALQGGPLRWAAVHRAHHQHADKDMDPHSPNAGLLWAHIGWTFFDLFEDRSDRDRQVPDLSSDGVLRALENHHATLNVLFAISLAVCGFAMGGVRMSASLIIWAFACRILLLAHSTFLINSAAHKWGYRSYETRDRSRNNWLLGILAFGEGWHNNHHAYPSIAQFGHRWFELDVSYWLIRVMESMGLAYDVKRRSLLCNFGTASSTTDASIRGESNEADHAL